MNRSLKKLTTTPSSNHLNNFILKSSLSLLFFFCLMFNTKTTSAQTDQCPEGDPLQWAWIQEIIANSDGCYEAEIQQFEYDGALYFQTIPGETDINCLADVPNKYYDCQGNNICNTGGVTHLSMWCAQDIITAADNHTSIWTYEDNSTIGCPDGDPLEWDWIQDLIATADGCATNHIRQFNYESATYFYTVPEQGYYYCELGVSNDNPQRFYDCTGNFICFGGFGPPCDSPILQGSGDYTTIWTYEETASTSTCPEGEPLQWNWIQGLIQSSGYCTIGELRQFEYEGDTYFYNTPREFDDGIPCKADYYPFKYYNCNGEYVCEVGLLPPGDIRRCGSELASPSLNNYSIIWVYQDEPVLMNQIKCPENNSTSICAPVAMPPSLTMQDFSTSNDPNYMNAMSMQIEEQTDVQQYFNTTTRVYIISDESGNQKTCETKHHIANQFLQMPEVAQPGIICEEDLWSYVKIGTDQYMLYADQNGSKGSLMSICNTPSLICSTADLGVDTKEPNQYNFWASTFFEFPDGTICESEAAPLYVDVQAKPVATLSAPNKTINLGEGIELMDLVSENKSGYWSGENIIYLMTATGENIAYFSSNEAGLYKLYYTVKNDNCERSYLMVVEVASAGKPAATQASYKTTNATFNMYPNPSTNKVFIDLPDEAVYQISLTDISGKVMKQLETTMNESPVQLKVNDLPKGMYLVALTNEQTQSIQKLIIE